MGVSFNKVSLPVLPLRSISEEVFVLPTEGGHIVENHGFKLLLFFHAMGRVVIDGADTFDLGDGDILILPHPCNQEYSHPSREVFTRVHALVVSVDYRLVQRRVRRSTNSRAENLEFADFLRTSYPEPTHIRGELNPGIWDTMKELRRECEHALLLREEKIQALLESLLVELSRAQAGRQSASKDNHLVERTKHFLRGRISQELSLPVIARHLRVSREHLAREFHKHTGLTIFEFLRDIRIEHAKSLLLSTESSVKDIAREAGFTHQSAFCRTFQKSVGLSAMQYRKRFSEYPFPAGQPRATAP